MDGARFDTLMRTWRNRHSRRRTLAGVLSACLGFASVLPSEDSAAHDNWSRCKNIKSDKRKDKCQKKGQKHKKWHETNACRSDGQTCGARPCCEGEALSCIDGYCARKVAAGPVDPMISFEEIDASEACVELLTMRTPWPSYPGYLHPTWRVITGYGRGACHSLSSCGGDQTYSFDLVPDDGTNAGGRLIVAPVSGIVEWAGTDSDFPGIGYLVKIKITSGAWVGYLVHLYHLMDLQVSTGTTVEAGAPIGRVYNDYNGNPLNNHLHFHVSDLGGRSVEFKLAGRSYRAGQSWEGTKIRNTVLYSGPTFSGDRSQVLVASDDSLGDEHIGNDNASSLRVNDGCSLTLYEHTVSMGRSRTFNAGDHGDLGDFNNQASSYQLSCP